MQDLRVNAGEIELQVREYERDGIPILFLHFGGGNLMMWQRSVPGWVHPYGWLLAPDQTCQVILGFLAEVSGSPAQNQP